VGGLKERIVIVVVVQWVEKSGQASRGLLRCRLLEKQASSGLSLAFRALAEGSLAGLVWGVGIMPQRRIRLQGMNRLVFPRKKIGREGRENFLQVPPLKKMHPAAILLAAWGREC
jgi:hypothetical protein